VSYQTYCLHDPIRISCSVTLLSTWVVLPVTRARFGWFLSWKTMDIVNFCTKTPSFPPSHPPSLSPPISSSFVAIVLRLLFSCWTYLFGGQGDGLTVWWDRWVWWSESIDPWKTSQPVEIVHLKFPQFNFLPQ